MEEYLDLLTLQQQVKEGLAECFPDKVWVKAEVAAVQVRANGHCYLDLVQSKSGVQKAKVKAIIWSTNYHLLNALYRESTGSPISAGQLILIRTQVNYSELYGLSLIIDDIKAEFTIGDAQKQKMLTIGKLTENGLMDIQSKLEMTPVPSRLAVISARDAAGYGDFCKHLAASGYAFEVVLVEAAMQGTGAPASVARAFRTISKASVCGYAEDELTGECISGPFDAVLLLRGGGSALDLACFDDYELCVALALCPVPVFTAIGHDRDFHVADMAAYRHVKTPTALADEFIGMLRAQEDCLEFLRERLRRALQARIALEESRTEMLALRIAAADPRALLKRGYTLVTDSAGKVLKSVAGLKQGDRITVRMADGRKDAEIL